MSKEALKGDKEKVERQTLFQVPLAGGGGGGLLKPPYWCWHGIRASKIMANKYIFSITSKLVKRYFGTTISVDREDNVTYTDNYSLIFISFYSITGQNISFATGNTRVLKIREAHNLIFILFRSVLWSSTVI